MAMKWELTNAMMATIMTWTAAMQIATSRMDGTVTEEPTPLLTLVMKYAVTPITTTMIKDI